MFNKRERCVRVQSAECRGSSMLDPNKPVPVYSHWKRYMSLCWRVPVSPKANPGSDAGRVMVVHASEDGSLQGQVEK